MTVCLDWQGQFVFPVAHPSGRDTRTPRNAVRDRAVQRIAARAKTRTDTHANNAT